MGGPGESQMRFQEKITHEGSEGGNSGCVCRMVVSAQVGRKPLRVTIVAAY